MPERTALPDQHVLVIGAGVGGLVSALLLAHQGHRVTLVEAADQPGGKLRELNVGGSVIDSGPTVFTMKWVFEQIFDAVGASLTEKLTLQALDVLGRHAWRGSDKTLDLFSDVQRSADAIAEFSSSAEARRFLLFCEKARAVYQHLEGPYIRAARPTLPGMARKLGLSGLSTLASLGPFSSLWQSLGTYFHDPRLQQLFGRYATYCGASPWQAPATLMLVADVEMQGVWSIQGGMHQLARVLADMAQEQGATLRMQTPCQKILVQNGRACGAVLAHGEQIAADAVVFNGDSHALALGLLGSDVQGAVPATKPAARSLSALTWSVKARASGFPLVRHNVFFDDDYAQEFTDIFQHRQLPKKATVYVCAQDRTDTGSDPGQMERLLLLVNAPADGDTRTFNPPETQPCQEQSLQLLSQCGLSLDPSSMQSRLTTPSDFNQLFPATGGALYGPASHGWTLPFRRPSSVSRLTGLFLTGGSVHPGPGVPMAALSGQRAAETVMAYLASTSRSARGATSGGTSTPSAMTANTL
jgi:1-hydroxycarotenoid 3,4-desaturase